MVSFAAGEENLIYYYFDRMVLVFEADVVEAVNFVVVYFVFESATAVNSAVPYSVFESAVAVNSVDFLV